MISKKLFHEDLNFKNFSYEIFFIYLNCEDSVDIGIVFFNAARSYY